MINEKLQKILIVLVVVLIFFVVVKAYNEFLEGKYIGKEIAPVNTINISATGEVFAKPDIAQISVSVVREEKTAVDAQNQNTEAMNKIVKFLKDSKIDDKDVKTTGYNIYPKYDYIERVGQVLKGYEVSQTLDVKVRKIDEAGKILSGAVERGANQVGGINLAIDNEDALKREARQKAITEAKRKANDLEKDLGVNLGRLVSFSESFGGYPIPVYGMMKTEGVGGAASAPEIPTGENKISVSVSLTYEIR
jgi:uncharacterized protein YggE